jgi:hypothetical protein
MREHRIRLVTRLDHGAARIASASLVLGLLLSALAPSIARAQIASSTPESYLRIDQVVQETKRGQPRLTGYLYNTQDKWATRVLLQIETLDEAGLVIGSTLVPVYGDVPPRNRSYFEAALETAGASYRVTVRTVDWRGYGAGGG